MDELLPSKLMIQGFNQGGQRAIGKIRLHMLIGEMESSVLFHVIDAKTTYKVLLEDHGCTSMVLCHLRITNALNISKIDKLRR